jgi:peptidoglycan-associated lipoprotein
MKKAALYLALAVLAAACASKETKTDAPVSDISSGTKAPQQTATAPQVTPQPPAQGISGNALTTGQLANRSVYFDFDSNAVKDEYRGLVQAHARYMTADKKDASIRIEGNCDERGSREYNLALGQRRAEAVKNVMTVLGVQNGRIETVSFGEEKPAAMGHDETSWAKNRRADIKYSGER